LPFFGGCHIFNWTVVLNIAAGDESEEEHLNLYAVHIENFSSDFVKLNLTDTLRGPYHQNISQQQQQRRCWHQ
jgi:hypothetical protein